MDEQAIRQWAFAQLEGWSRREAALRLSERIAAADKLAAWVMSGPRQPDASTPTD